MEKPSFHEQGQLLVLLASKDPFTDAWWTKWCDAIRSASIRGTVRVFVDAREGNVRPTSVQREMLRESAPPHLIKSAVVTDSMIVRGIITALSWYDYADNKAFDSHSFRGALDHLECDSKERAWVLSLCAPVP